MACHICAQEEYYSGSCRSCFVKGIEKRIRKTLRLQGSIDRHDTLLIQDLFCQHVIQTILHGLPITIVQQGAGMPILPWTMDDEIDLFLDRLFNNQPLAPATERRVIKLFLGLTDKEYEAYAIAKGFTTIVKERKYASFLNELEQRHKETRYTLIKTIDELQKVLRQPSK
ncbi:hypothetical protein HYS47_02870 [Candidatus Woesearchaeota archaeon]|nr:hypothetical protein [Candidatus Woesearchaeota archaeon]